MRGFRILMATKLLNKKYCIYFSIAIAIALLQMRVSFAENLKPLKNSFTFHKSLHSAKTTQTPPASSRLKLNPGKHLRLPILMYHHVGVMPKVKNDRIREDLTVSPEDFERQIKWLKQEGFETISLSNFYNYTKGEFVLPKKPVILTFDDGYDDVFINAVPILKKYSFMGSFAVITKWPGTENGTNKYATWDQITEAVKDSMEIVCHTENHFDGTNRKFDSAFIFQNLTNCKRDIAEHLGTQTNILIYPYGHYNQFYIEQAKKVGFQLGLTVHPGAEIDLENLMEMPRVRVHGHEDFEMFKKLLQH